MTQIDPLQLMNLDGSPLTPEQVAALAPPAPPAAAATPPAPAPVPAPEPTGPSQEQVELAIARAGFNLNDPLVGALAKGYDGDLTAETITAAMAAVGVVPTGAAPPAEIIPPAAQGQADTRQGLAGQEYIPPPPPPDKTAYQRANDAIELARAEGHDEAIQRQVGIQEVLGAAMEGDMSVTVGQRHQQRVERWNELGQLSNTR